MGLFFGFGLAALLVATLYAPVLPQFLSVSGSAGKSVEEWSNPIWALLELIRGLKVGGAGSAVLAAGALVFAAGCRRLLVRSPLVLELFVFPVGVTLAVVLLSGHHIWPRLVLFAMGHAMMIVVAGALAVGEIGSRLFGYDRRYEVKVGMVGVVAACAVFVSALPRAYGPKQDFVAAARFVREHAEPGDAVAVAGLAAPPYERYYHTGWKVVLSADELEAIRRRSSRTWFVYTFPFQLESRFPDIMAMVARDFVDITRFDGTVGGGSVYVMRSDG